MTIAVIQARMSSSRFPGKSLALLNGEPLYLHACKAALAAKSVDKVVLATSDDPSDDPLAEDAKKQSLNVYRGDLENVRLRVYHASEGHTTVVRITADCPLVRPEDIDVLVNAHHAGLHDYSTNTMPPTFPDGMDIEVFARELLLEADQEIDDLHVTAHFRRNRDKYKCFNVRNVVDLSQYSLTVDDPEDIPAIEKYLESGEWPEKRRNMGIVEDFIKMMDDLKPRPVTTEQDKHFADALKLLPGGAQTFSKMPDKCCKGFGPTVACYYEGASLVDMDGNRYIDYICGLGARTAGSRRRVCPECYALPEVGELYLAERINNLIPSMEMMRYFKNGSDATTAAVRLARHITGRDEIVSYGYHGWHDAFCHKDAFGEKSAGSIGDRSAFKHVPQLAHVYAHVGATTAAVIIEPANEQYLTPEQAQQLEKVCKVAGALLIYDEIVTFPRFGMGGIQAWHRVTPDITCIGKGMGDGAAISVVGGKREVMEHFCEIFASGTFGGESGAIEVAYATLGGLVGYDYPGHVHSLGKLLQDGYNALVKKWDLEEVTSCIGLPQWPIITWNSVDYTYEEYSTFFQQELLRRGVLHNGNLFVTLHHTEEDAKTTLDAYDETLRLMRMAIDYGILDKVIIGEVNKGGVRRLTQ